MPRKPPELLTTEQQQLVVSVIMAGGDRRTAADYAGCSRSGIRATEAADEAFRERMERAESHFELVQLDHIKQAGMREQYWRAAAWVLERKFPSRYAKARPRTLTHAQVRVLLEELADLVAAEVQEAEAQERLLQRVKELLAKVKVDPA